VVWPFAGGTAVSNEQGPPAAGGDYSSGFSDHQHMKVIHNPIYSLLSTFYTYHLRDFPYYAI
jgi:hypothetical protein